MKTLLDRQPPWLIWLGGATLSTALTVVAYLWIVVPVHERQVAETALQASLAQKQSEGTSLEAQLDDFSQRLYREQAALADQPVELGDRRELNRRIASLIASAQRLDLEVLQLQPGRVTTGEHFDLVEMQLESSGPFPGHLEMLDTLHRDYPDMSVTDLSLSSAVRSAHPRPTLVLRLAWFTRVEDPHRDLSPHAVEAAVDTR